ncbi:MAG: hypothetical protein Kow0022_04290 [Phycisphaerales bacterium]
MTGSRENARRGSVYVLVLAVSLFVVGAAAAAAILARERIGEGTFEQQVHQAALAAESGVELLWKTLEESPNWRASLVAGQWFVVLDANGIMVEAMIEDLTSQGLDSQPPGAVRLTARATTGDIVQLRSIVLDAAADDPTDLIERPGSRKREVLP